MESTIHTSTDWRFLVAFVVICWVCWWISKQFDDVRITNYGKENGWRFEKISYRLFGGGWFGEKGARFYSVRYIDEKGDLYTARCKTSMFSGVYFTNVKKIGKHVPSVPSLQGPEIDCPRCGAFITKFDRVCPNCKTER